MLFISNNAVDIYKLVSIFISSITKKHEIILQSIFTKY
jgi:hypothetical protein